ncbi:MAG: cysteine--tRNA ligase [Candidatus Berkelbacteria bacterium]|nr:cysteine--tRNA ligase [Candidatus Berkelbacteria bacterium]
MKLYNTLSKSVEEFKPQTDKKVKLYTCGPTVYNFAHIGNLRTYIFEDVLRRSLEFLGYSVHHVMNMTDVDDKTIKASRGKQQEFKELTKKFEVSFLADLHNLNIEKPTEITRATEYIEQIVEFVSDLLDKGFAYKGEDGSIYFSIEKFADYGKLSGLDKDGIKSGARVAQDEYTKENPADFALWKAWDEADGEIFWQTKLGKGRPGWHIECSAMSQDKLGDTLDIHAGAVDLVFAHHENEIAQSEARTGKKFVNYWVHAEHLLVDGKKMSKSLGNIYVLSDIEKKGFSPLDFRYLCLSASYRDKLNFTWESLEAAKNALTRAKKILNNHQSVILNEVKDPDSSLPQNDYLDKFKSALENDLNTPEALAVFWNMLRDDKLSAEIKKASALEMDKIFVLDLDKEVSDEIPASVQKLVDERIEARKNKNFELSDKLRDEIESLGYSVEDSGTETKILKK